MVAALTDPACGERVDHVAVELAMNLDLHRRMIAEKWSERGEHDGRYE